jgi:hypothetical protein
MTASDAEKPASCAHKSAPSSRPATDPLSWISLDLQGWTPCMPISICLSELRSSSGRMNPVLGGASQSAATLCAGCVANRLRRSHLVLLPHHRAGRPTHPEGSLALLGAGALPPNIEHSLGLVFARFRLLIRCRLPPPKSILLGQVGFWASR